METKNVQARKKVKQLHIPRFLFWSGGADSTYMMLRLFEEGIRVDKIFFSDTGKEFPEMYEYVEKVKAFMMRKYEVEIHHFHPKEGRDYKSFSREVGFIRGEDKVRGIPRQLEPCWLQRNTKIRPFEYWLTANQVKDHLVYIGYTADELKRAKMKVRSNNEKELKKIEALEGEERSIALEKLVKKFVTGVNQIINNNHIYPLIIWDIEGDQVKVELQKRGMLNPLYKHFDRTGCFMCPKVGEDTYYKLWKFHPKQWKWMKKEEKRMRKLQAFGDQFNKDETIKEMETRFEKSGYNPEIRSTTEQDFCFCVI